MGEMAEMMLDGTLCELCGVYLDGTSPGFPRYCCDEHFRDRTPDLTEEDREFSRDVVVVKPR